MAPKKRRWSDRTIHVRNHIVALTTVDGSEIRLTSSSSSHYLKGFLHIRCWRIDFFHQQYRWLIPYRIRWICFFTTNLSHHLISTTSCGRWQLCWQATPYPIGSIYGIFRIYLPTFGWYFHGINAGKYIPFHMNPRGQVSVCLRIVESPLQIFWPFWTHSKKMFQFWATQNLKMCL